MSLESWKKEFYRTPASKVSRRHALKHSLKKWVGLLSKNRRKHRVQLYEAQLSDNDCNTLDIDSDSCALCHHYIDKDCEGCPISFGLRCTNKYASIFFNKPLPMINLLKKTLKRKENK